MKKTIIIMNLILFNIIGFSQDFEIVSNVDLKGGYLGFASWCDYNSDGYLDAFVTGLDFGDGFTHAELYKNNGDKTFSETNFTLFPRVIYGDISWGDYNNDGTLDLIFAGTKSGFSEDNYTGIFKNQGDTNFVEITHSVPKLGQCHLEWTDVNIDGLLDIYYQGINSRKEFDMGIYKNVGNDDFEKVNINIEKISGPRGNGTKNSAKWADFDNDGYKDVIIAMSSSNEFRFEFYRNLGNFSFQKVDIGLPNLNYVQLAVGDINNDGLYDIVFTGSTEQTLSSSDNSADIYIFINNGELSFTNETKIDNVGVFDNTLELGDFNNDGYYDIIYYGAGSSLRNMNIYTNNQNNTFSSFSHSITTSSDGGATLGDFDNDNDLDILYYGRIYNPSEEEVTYVYENKSLTQNELPTPPDSIAIWAIGNDLLISWSDGSDDSTSIKCLNYNLRLGVENKLDSLMSSYSLNGKLKYPSLGNINLVKEFNYNNLSSGEYSVVVQSIDNSYNASIFSDTLKFCFKETNNLWGDTITIGKNDSVKIECIGDYESYTWNTGSKVSAIYARKEGFYNVNLTHLDGCISSETVFVKVLEDFTQIISNKTFHAKIYPIPFNDHLIIDLNDELPGVTEIKIYSITGNLLYQRKANIMSNNMIQIMNLKNGIYFLTISNKNKRIDRTYKIIK